MKYTNIVFFITTIALIGCIKEVNPKIPLGNEGIVVSGGFFHYINNPDTPQYITITKTVPYTQTQILPENYIKNATVKVVSDVETFEFKYDDVANAYVWTPTTNSPITYNKKYTLIIEYEGNRYEGTDSMPAPVAIHSFYMAHTSNLFGKLSNPAKFVPRIQYSISPGRKNFYYWACRYIKFFDQKFDIEVFNPNKNSNSLLIGSESFIFTKDTDSVDIARSVDPQKIKDTILYFTGSQYHISKQTYDYQNILGTALGNMGPVASPSPPKVSSNVVCITDKSKLVFGYFMAASADVKTIRFPN